jgi:SAM-dependent methyltransferase
VGTLGSVTTAVKQIDPPKRLSGSLLWNMEERYYEQAGIEAWSSDGLPFTITNSPVLARAYVQLIDGLLEDCVAGRMGRFDAEQPLYVLDLGTGTGRLGYHIAELLQRRASLRAKVVTVLTDRVDANLEFLSRHAKLAPLIAAGLVDVARYDVATGGRAHLLHSGVDLVPGELTNPLVAIANYLFDVLPQDLYCSAPGGLEEELVEIYGDDSEPGSEGWELAEHIYLAAHRGPAEAERYAPRAAAVLDAMARERTGSNERFLFPIGSIEAIDRVRELAGDRLLLLIAERDDPELLPRSPGPGPAGGSDGARAEGAAPEVVAEAQQVGAVRPGTAYHPGSFVRLASYGPSFSLPVDLGAVATAARLVGAEMLRGAGSAHRLAVAAIVAGDGGAASSVRSRFANCVVDVAPDDLCKASTAAIAAVAVSGEHDEASLEVLLAAIRMSGYDPIVFASCFKDFAACLPPPPLLLPETLRILEQVEATNFWIRPQGDTAYAVATLVGRCGCYEQALELLDAAREAFGPRAMGSFNAAMCLLALGRTEDALASLDDCLALDGSYEPARQLRDRVLAGDISPPAGPA